MAEARTCPECGAELTPGALEGLCPKCIGKVTFGLDSNGEPVPSPAGSDPAPPPAEAEGTSPTVPAQPAPVSKQPGGRPHRPLQVAPAAADLVKTQLEIEEQIKNLPKPYPP